jgi:hypothetical protein
MSAQAVFTSAVAVAGATLKPRGFRRRGSKLTRTGDEVVSLIEFQRSRQSTAQDSTFSGENDSTTSYMQGWKLAIVSASCKYGRGAGSSWTLSWEAARAKSVRSRRAEREWPVLRRLPEDAVVATAESLLKFGIVR